MKKIGLILCILLFTDFSVKACSCKPLGEFTQEEFNELGVIFTGQVIGQFFDSIIQRSVLKIQVKKLFKGQDDNGFIYALNSWGNCSVHLKKDDNFLFFLYGKVDNPSISMCSRKIRIQDPDNFFPPNWLTHCTKKPDGMDKSYYPSKKLASEGRLVSQNPEGFWKYYKENGSLSSTGFYKNGLKDSIWTYYGYGGKTKKIASYKLDKLHGKSIRYYENGNKDSEDYYVNGLKHGFCYGLYKDGTKCWEKQYVNGESVKYSHFNKNGNKEKYRDDTLEASWYENGNKHYERYSKNRKDYYQRYWWENGQLRAILIFDEKGESNYVYASLENGEVIVENGTGYYDMWGIKGECKDSLKVGTWQQRFNNGTIEETKYKKGNKNGTFKRWNKDGKLMSSGFHKEGLEDGIFKRWNEDGKQIFEGLHKEGKPFGIWKFWYDNGQIQLERRWVNSENLMVNSWKPDGSQMVKDGNGRHEYYNNDGTKSKIMSPTMFENGKMKTTANKGN